MLTLKLTARTWNWMVGRQASLYFAASNTLTPCGSSSTVSQPHWQKVGGQGHKFIAFFTAPKRKDRHDRRVYRSHTNQCRKNCAVITGSFFGVLGFSPKFNFDFRIFQVSECGYKSITSDRRWFTCNPCEEIPSPHHKVQGSNPYDEPSLSKRTKDSLSTFYQSKMEGITDNQELGFYVIQLGRIEQCPVDPGFFAFFFFGGGNPSQFYMELYQAILSIPINQPV